MADKSKIFKLLDNLDCISDELDELGYSKYTEYVSQAMSVICDVYKIDKRPFAALSES